ncbi:MAG: ABC transporter substrate-binding protein [Blautia massiliensis (ex Durand et al. 2017)]|nr:MAG: ABC transporter substrate-binding protein [Subdoligranulum variabile]
MKKYMKLTAALLAGAMALSLTACGGNTGSTAETSEAASSTGEAAAADGEKTVIKFANYALLESGYTEFWEGIKTGFEEKYPQYEIEWVTAPYGEIVNQVINQAGGGDKPDIMFGESTWVPTLVDAGLAIPVSEVFTEDYLAKFDQNALESCMTDGEVCGLPMYDCAFMLFYNKDLFEQAGLDPNTPPTTYDEMLKMAEKLSQLTTADGNKVYAFGQTTASVAISGSAINSMIFNFGGTVLDENGQLAIDNQGFKDAITMLQTLDQKGYNPQNAKLKDLRQLFATGQLAMYYDQSWGFNGVTTINPDAAEFAASAMPLKGGEGDGASMLSGQILMYMDNGEAQREGCRLLTEYMLTEEVLGDYIRNITPAYPIIEDMKDMELNPVLEGARDATQSALNSPSIPMLNDLNLELCTLAQNVTVGGADVDTAIEDFRSAAQNYVE